MPDSNLEQARVLIRQKHYAEARALLERSDNPDAADLLMMIQRIESSEAQTAAATLGLFFTLSAIITGIIFASISYFVFLGFLKRQTTTKR
jgi:hypothetical protein